MKANLPKRKQRWFNNIRTRSRRHSTYGAQTTAEMWKQLSDVKEPKGIHGIVNAYRAMFRTYTNEGDSIIDHISKLHTHWNMLSTLGALIPDEMFTILVSASLPDSWDSFTRSYFGNKAKATVTSQELIGLVVDKVKRLTMREKETDITNQMRLFNNNTQTQNTNLNVNSMRNQPCQNCDRPGHTKGDCWARGGGSISETTMEREKEKWNGKPDIWWRTVKIGTQPVS